MENEFVTYELAVKLKELGFNEPCMASRDMGNNHGLIQVPTWQSAFRWFREKYGYLHHITYFDPVKAQIPGEADYQGLVLFPHQDVHKLAKISYDTYEEAELACLEKLIEIAERNGKEEML
jgi:hypothetical protein